jgi:hypothetical protein
VQVPNFYLDTAKGGLTIIKEGGSRQTTGLRLKSISGKEYVLRSVDKDFGNGLEDIYKGTFISNIAKDQASIGYPFAAITITPMITAAGIYHTNPVIVFVPDQKALNGFDNEYKNQLYLFEERPDEDWSDAAFFGYSKNITGSEKLFENLYKDNDNSVDAKAFAKARLFDMFISDWGRHTGQWRWAGFKEGKKTIYKPIPRDRDQTYTRFDGFFPFIATNIAGPTHLENFGGKISNVKNFNLPARQLDRRLLISLTKEDWINLARELQLTLTDGLIDSSIRLLPASIFVINGEKIIRNLKSRRDHLHQYAETYYKYLNMQVSLQGSDKKEHFKISSTGNGQTMVSIYKMNTDLVAAEKPYFERTFNGNETNKIFIYGFKGQDIFEIKGNKKNKTQVHIIGFTKKDSLITDSKSPQKIVKIHKGNMDKYDTLMQQNFKVAPVIILSPKEYKVFNNDPVDLFTTPGLHVGLNFKYNTRRWKKDSLETNHQLAINYGFLRKTLYAEYVGIYPRAIGTADLVLRSKLDMPAAENYFGTGNETVNNISTTASYYSVFSTRFFAGIGLRKQVKNQHFEGGIFYQQIKINSNTGKYFSAGSNDIALFQTQKFAGIEAGYKFQKINDRLIPTKGITFSAGAAYITNIERKNRSFIKLNSSIAGYIPIGSKLSFATRAGVQTVNGTADYYHLGKLGGNENLRGYRRERFYGKTAAYSNNEIRFIANTKNVVFNGRIGVLAFTDFGRVWQTAENSKKIHIGYGGGLVLSPFNEFVLVGTYGMTAEGTNIIVQARLFF